MPRDRMQRQRFELKYLLEESTALGVREFVRPHLDMDEAGVGKPNYAYAVNSLYLDSDSLYSFWDWVNSNRNRFKLRMRFYDDNPNTPVFLEIKRRISGCIHKQRCGIRKHAARLVLAGQMPDAADIMTPGPKGLLALQEFINMIERYEARPRALVTYHREAYIDSEQDSVRVTMDRQVRIGLRENCAWSLDMDEYVQPFDEKVILELKFTNRYPNWFNEMVQVFNLTRGAAAKYCEGMAALQHPQLGNCPPQPLRYRVAPVHPEAPVSSLVKAEVDTRDLPAGVPIQ